MKYFGTDGIRGVANEMLTPEIAFELGRVIGETSDLKKKVVIGKDSRISGDMLESAVVAGITASGGDVYRVGVLPTPAVNYIVKKHNADYGIVISASHNPVIDNGIKVVDSDGKKISSELEEKIEKFIDGEIEISRKIAGRIGRVYDLEVAKSDYIEMLVDTVSVDSFDFKVVIDCANGASSYVAPIVFNTFMKDVIYINNEPNGLNINDRCGSTNTKNLSEVVVEEKAHFGIAFDGDADRIIFVDGDGNDIDGDYIIYILVKKYLDENKLVNNAIALTTMSNLGVINNLKNELNVDVKITDVGDKYVSHALDKYNLNLGGETSGHIILKDYAPSGDGILVALQVLDYFKKSGNSLQNLIKSINKYPSVLVNVKVIDKDYSLNHRSVLEEIRRVENILEDSGRVLVRASGTEQMIRVLVECEDGKNCIEYSNSISETIRELNEKVN
ncbi:MAG: phosphoglucosamine mutase [Bacilli bacterium]